MKTSSQPFWEKVRELWHVIDDSERNRVTHFVLLNLRKRLPHQDARMIFDLLPSEIASLSAEPGIAVLEDKGHRPVLDVDKDEFIRLVSEQATVSEQTALQATIAVFGATRSLVPERESDHIRFILPKGLKEVWGGKGKPEE
ncbi:DUF2267 domain-containing protein [Chitinispirillales bacterium ANBcel5]|uniref:DUF2267 domain-containing protein n=1 Tax=Cellulosispirillum alkaliphilum TaxID=3039283 RepID=UPI002A4FC1BA|nr:DUF2267 domain-containing protein [Chitinispirillales bacterium ANBcel5]